MVDSAKRKFYFVFSGFVIVGFVWHLTKVGNGLTTLLRRREFELQTSPVEHSLQNDHWTPNTTLIPCKNTDIASDLFLSQDQEDQTLLRWFRNLCGGTYLEIGALNGKQYSTSHAFHFGLHWKGVLIEASPSSYKGLVVNRPHELATVNKAVCDKPRQVHFIEKLEAPELGGIWEFADEAFRNTWWSGTTVEAGIAIECVPLTDILTQHVGEHFFFDFFSLDIEGGEFSVLKTLDFQKFSFGIIFVESSYHAGTVNEMRNQATKSRLESHGYQFLMEFGRSYWFANKDFDKIYQEFVQF